MGGRGGRRRGGALLGLKGPRRAGGRPPGRELRPVRVAEGVVRRLLADVLAHYYRPAGCGLWVAAAADAETVLRETLRGRCGLLFEGGGRGPGPGAWRQGRPRGLALRFNLLFLGMIIIAGAFRFSHLGSGLTLELIRLETRVAGILFLVFLLAKAKDDLNLSLAEANRIQEIAHTDTLTLLPNRRGMTALLEEHLTRKRHFSVILTDVDYFKRINDTFGHETGDQILREVGECLHLQLRASDVIGRWGGEEFLIIALEEDEKRALNLANRLRETVESYEFSNNLPITMSFGVTLSRERDTVKSLLQRADTAMYRAKNNGRNRVEWENPNSML